MSGRKRPPGRRYKPGYGRPDRRGGRRAGSGRKKLSEAEKAARDAARRARMTDDDVARLGAGHAAAFAAADASTEDVNELARKFSPNAMRVLALVAATGKSETARVAAAAKIIEIDRANRNTDAPVLAPLGKKEMALEAARLAAQAVDWGEDLQPPGYKN
jgi:hypothetical protein